MRKALELDEQLAGAHTALGVVLANTGRRAEAIDEWKRAVQLDRAELDALFNLTVNLDYSGQSYSGELAPDSSSFWGLGLGFDWY